MMCQKAPVSRNGDVKMESFIIACSASSYGIVSVNICSDEITTTHNNNNTNTLGVFIQPQHAKRTERVGSVVEKIPDIAATAVTEVSPLFYGNGSRWHRVSLVEGQVDYILEGGTGWYNDGQRIEDHHHHHPA